MRKGSAVISGKPVVFQPISDLARFYFYGIQGFCYEIIFTSLFDFFFHGDWRLIGHSAVSSFFIYGSCSYFTERLYIYLYYKHGIKWYIRKPLYLIIAYTWEFIFGIILKQFDACPWDYSHYPYNFMGLITLEYAPGWLFLAHIQDVQADFLLRLRIIPEVNHHEINNNFNDNLVSLKGKDKRKTKQY